MRRKRRHIVVHFDRLRPCHSGARLFLNHTPNTDNNKTTSNKETHFGSKLELIDGEDNVEANTGPGVGKSCMHSGVAILARG